MKALVTGYLQESSSHRSISAISRQSGGLESWFSKMYARRLSAKVPLNSGVAQQKFQKQSLETNAAERRFSVGKREKPSTKQPNARATLILLIRNKDDQMGSVGQCSRIVSFTVVGACQNIPASTVELHRQDIKLWSALARSI